MASIACAHYHQDSDYPLARRHTEEAVAWLSRVGNTHSLACAPGGLELAARLFAARHTLLDNNELTLSYPDQREYDRTVVQVRAGLGEDAWQTAWAEGARHTPSQALAPVQSTSV